jgi:23S rRNA (pseudouridine1915-N3)-methyltransferase
VRLGLLWVGRTRDANIGAALRGYLERIQRYLPVRVIEVREERAADRHAAAGALVKEGRRIRQAIPGGHEVVLMDPGGREMSSEQFARFLEATMNGTRGGLTFVVGGHLGVDDGIRDLADHSIALSRMTLTHEMARLVMVEQIYRALSIIRGGRYHR